METIYLHKHFRHIINLLDHITFWTTFFLSYAANLQNCRLSSSSHIDNIRVYLKLFKCIPWTCSIYLVAVQHCTALKRSVLQCTALKRSVLQCTALTRSVLQCTALKRSVLQCTALKRSVLQCTALKRSVLQCTALKRSVLH